jgi:hypothetical protein
MIGIIQKRGEAPVIIEGPSTKIPFKRVIRKVIQENFPS